MKISYVFPFELTQTPIEADTDRDFYKIPVNSIGYVESNKFLVSLWNQVNIQLCPDHCVDRAPWAYFPGKYIGKKSSVSVLGFCQTCLGELYFALEYKTKGNIDSLLVMRPISKLKHEEIQSIKNIVASAKTYQESTMRFLCNANILAELKNVRFSEYQAENFSVVPTESGIEFCFYVNAIDKFEAEQQALERLYEVCAFLSVETNIYCHFDTFIVSDDKVIAKGSSFPIFIDDYIDNYPAIKNWKICISRYAYDFISQNILSIGRFERRCEVEKFFISACKHIQLGLESELKMGDVAIANIPFSTIALTKRDQRNKVEHMTSALMSYLSAIECATATDANHETCPECGAVKYKIADRVRHLATEFLGEHLGNVFHRLYSFRSKFLHTGRMASDANVVRTIPLLSETSETGVKEYGNVAIKLDGKVFSVNVSNVREWSTYILRCYYQKRILGRTEFENVFNEKQDFTLADFPLRINAVSPEGSQQLKEILVRTDSFSYKIRRFYNHLKVKVIRFFGACTFFRGKHSA